MAQGTMTIDPKIMLSVAQTVDAQCSIMENCLNSIISGANSLKSEWEGESATAYQAVITKIQENSLKIVAAFREYSRDLNTIATGFMTEEQKRKAISEALPDNVFGE
jgi:WXG100 family type VII secretion target